MCEYPILDPVLFRIKVGNSFFSSMDRNPKRRLNGFISSLFSLLSDRAVFGIPDAGVVHAQIAAVHVGVVATHVFAAEIVGKVTYVSSSQKSREAILTQR